MLAIESSVLLDLCRREREEELGSLSSNTYPRTVELSRGFDLSPRLDFEDCGAAVVLELAVGLYQSALYDARPTPLSCERLLP